MASPLARFDDTVARVEKAVVLVFLAVMTAAVFFDVLHRVASSPDGLVLKLLLAFAGDAPSESTRALLADWIAPGILRGIFFGVVYAALRTARGSTASAGRSALYALGITAVVDVALRILLVAFPNGLIWSQPLSLSLLLWVALIGATIATKERGHIVLQIADRLWSGSRLRYVRLMSGLLAGTFCLVLVLLGAHYTADFYDQWQDGVGYVSGVPIPKWVVYLAIPVTFAVMTLRFAGYAIGDFLRNATPEAIAASATSSANTGSDDKAGDLS